MIRSVYPNPVKNVAIANLWLDHNSEINLMVYNLLGKKVIDFRKQMQKGEEQITADFSDLSDGYYLVKLFQDGQFKDARKIVKAR